MLEFAVRCILACLGLFSDTGESKGKFEDGKDEIEDGKVGDAVDVTTEGGNYELHNTLKWRYSYTRHRMASVFQYFY